ncbi:hypothetical protein Golomagni_07188 [Golovinomyces magnicellulatus]|nr:hypothetical protein Golomagni_07188 [Golovinomyces magnicellulatus]
MLLTAILASRTSTHTASLSSASTGNASTTATSSSGSAALLSGSSTSAFSRTCNNRLTSFISGRSNYTTTNLSLQKLEKKIPNQPTNVTPVELRTKQIFADVRIGPGDGKPFTAGEAKQ